MTSASWDLCIVGAGPAGMTLALEATRIQPGMRVVVVEFGRDDELEDNELDASIQLMNPANHYPPSQCTNKGLGGSSKTWGGRCVTYNPIDFHDRPVLKGECTWNENLFRDVIRYYEHAARYLECGEPVFDLEPNAPPIAQGFRSGAVTDTSLERWSPPTRFGTSYRQELSSRPGVAILEGMRAVELLAKDSVVGGLVVEDRKTRKRETIEAKRFVVAAGAQETTRLLLKSPSVFGGSLPDALGRFYQGHLSGKIATVRFSGDPKSTEYGFRLALSGIYTRRRFQLREDTLQRENLLNTAFWLDNPLYEDPSHRNGALSFIYLMMVIPAIRKRLAPPTIADAVAKGPPKAIGQHLRNVVLGLPSSLIVPAALFRDRYLKGRKLPGVFLYNARNEYALHFHAEQVPDRENRMELSPDGEKLIIHYGYHDRDVESVVRSHQILDQHLRACGAGELCYWWGPGELADKIREGSKDGVHQMGTTRISNEPSRGVVDPNLRVWNTENLFVCSSSAFPTSSQANPTFLLVAFAARLADHLTKS